MAVALWSEKLAKTWDKYIEGRDTEDRNLLLEHYLPRVERAADSFKNHLPNHIELDDLVSAGVFGMMDAMKTYDPGRGVKFETHLERRLRGSMLDYLRVQDNATRLVRARETCVNDAVNVLRVKFGREPDENELLKELTKEKYVDNSISETSLPKRKKKARAMLNDGYSVSGVLSGETMYHSNPESNSVTLFDIIGGSVDPDTGLDYSELVGRVLNSMPDRARILIEMHYNEYMNFKQIGDALNLSECRVCGMHKQIIDWMRTTVDDLGGGCVNAPVNRNAKIPRWRKRRSK